MLKRLWENTSLEKVFGCDLRSLALLRVTIAIILILDWWNRLLNFNAFMSERGLFPRQALLQLYGSPYVWSLGFISTGDWWQYLLLLANLLCSIALLFGIRTRLFSIFCWILQLSFQAKNPILMQSGDVLLRLILFWGMFLPWGAKFSLDAAFSRGERPKSIFSYATIGICLQTCYVYFFGVFLKNGTPWRVDGTAVYYALNIDHFSTEFGKFLLSLPVEALKFFSFLVLGFELLGPLLLLLPWGHWWLRPTLVLFFWTMHLSFGASLAIGNFVLISIASTIVFIPPELWNSLSRKLQKKTTAKVYYDEDCNFCVKMLGIVSEFLILPKHLFVPAQSEKRIEQQMLRQDSWVFEKPDKNLLFRSQALRELMLLSPIGRFFAWLFAIPGTVTIGDFFYRKIAANRSRSCKVEKPGPRNKSPIFELTAIENYFLAFVLVFCLLINIDTLPQWRTNLSRRFEPLAMVLRLDQRWDMFSPFPMIDDGWFIIKGKLKSGETVDLFQDGASLTYEKPESVKDMYKDFRWRKYMINLYGAAHSNYRPYFSRYLCRQWNQGHSEDSQVVSFDIIYMREDTPPPGEPSPKPVELNIFNWNCF